jgi:cysteinyl-tRNA synthetase
VDSIPAEISEMLGAQHEFRKNRNFEQSDRLRKRMADLGWLVKDGRPGEPSTVKKKRRAWD